MSGCWRGGSLVFQNFADKADVFLDGQMIGHKSDFPPTTFDVPVLPGDHDHSVVIVLEVSPNKPAGLGGRRNSDRYMQS